MMMTEIGPNFVVTKEADHNQLTSSGLEAASSAKKENVGIRNGYATDQKGGRQPAKECMKGDNENPGLEANRLAVCHADVEVGQQKGHGMEF